MNRSLEQVIEWRGEPAALRCDNGPKNVSETLIEWANKQQITLLYIQPGKPTQNSYIERFNRKARRERLDLHRFDSLDQARQLATQYIWEYNIVRTNTSVGSVPPRRLMMAALPSTQKIGY